VIDKGNRDMFKQLVFFKKRDDMTMEQFIDYYENKHSKLAKEKGLPPPMPNARRYVRRYLTPETNPVSGGVHDCGFDCIMEIWWDSREDFENSCRIISDPDRLPNTLADEKNFLASHDNPVCSAVEYDSPMGPNGEETLVEIRYDG
jgi:hypothetical protein